MCFCFLIPSGFRGRISVQPYVDLSSLLTITFDSKEVSYGSNICGQVLLDKAPTYSHLASETPVILSVSPSSAIQGSNIMVAVKGIIDSEEYNILTIGGKPCTTSSHTSTTEIEPVLELPVEGTYSYLDAIIDCTVPDIYPGDYRVALHVAGRGWSYGEIENSVLSIRSSIHGNDLSTPHGSLGGGTLLRIPVTGLDHYFIGQTSVDIGNTPCLIQEIVNISPNPLHAEIVCKTTFPRDDGYSSLVSKNALCYWSLQYDFYDSSNVKYSTESTQSFSSDGKIVVNTLANIVGNVEQGHVGISGGLYTDQSAYFSSSYLRVESFEQYQALSTFSFEIWFKSPMSFSYNKYVVLASSYQNSGGIARGFIITINPCNEIEYWLGTGEQIEDISDDSSGSSSVSNSGQGDCDDMSSCETECRKGYIVQRVQSELQFQMPVGVWRVLRSSSNIEFDEWNHVAFGFDAAINESSNQTSLQGTQILYINNELNEADDISYSHTDKSDLFFGGNEILHTNNIEVSSQVSQLYPFTGYIDEICLYDYMLTEQDVKDHYHYGTTDEQPLWINTEYVDGVWKGMVPDMETTLVETAFDELALDINLQEISDDSFFISKQKGIQIKWTG